MKKIVLVIAMLVSSSALAADFDAIAFERLAYELTSATTPGDKAESVSAYLGALKRLGTTPKSATGCLKSALQGTASDLCRSLRIEARSGGAGTGGAD